MVLAIFNNCPLIWMLSSKAASNEINRRHNGALRVLYKDTNLSFDKCLIEEAGITIHNKNFQKLIVEIFKSLN